MVEKCFGVMASQSYATATAMTQRFTYYLDVRNDYNPYQIPTVETITSALRSMFAEDTGLLVFPLPRENRGIFEVSITTRITDLTKYPIRLRRGNEAVDIFLSNLQNTTMSKKKPRYYW